MDEMIHYIFGSLRNSEMMFRAIGKSIRKQQSFNHNITFWITVVTMHLIVKEVEIRNMRCQIEALKTEIKELKETKEPG